MDHIYSVEYSIDYGNIKKYRHSIEYSHEYNYKNKNTYSYRLYRLNLYSKLYSILNIE